MSTSSIVGDGLWRCLCPSFESLSLSTTFAPIRTRRGNVHALPRQRPSRTQARFHHPIFASRRRESPIFRPSEQHNASRKLGPTGIFGSQRRKQPPTDLVHLPTPELYERLGLFSADGQCEAVDRVINILIRDRQQPPNLRMYSAILHSYANPEEGTAGKIRKILDDMEEDGIELDAGACHSVLKVGYSITMNI